VTELNDPCYGRGHRSSLGCLVKKSNRDRSVWKTTRSDWWVRRGFQDNCSKCSCRTDPGRSHRDMPGIWSWTMTCCPWCAWQSIPENTALEHIQYINNTGWAVIPRSTQSAARNLTRKLCYRTDDRALRPVYGCPENFRDSLTPTATFPKIFSWTFVLIYPMNVRTKFRSFTRSWDNRGYPKMWAVRGYAHTPSSKNF